MPGIEHRIQKCRTLRSVAPRLPFSPATPSTLPRAPLAASQRNRSLVTAFRSPVTAPAFTGSIPGLTFPACYFAVSANYFLRPFGLSAPQPDPGLHPVQIASTLQARCGFRNRLRPLLHWSPLPFGSLNPYGSKRSTSFAADRPTFRIRPISSRSPLPLLLLGAASDHRSRSATFPK